jgi:hypothetical protein
MGAGVMMKQVSAASPRSMGRIAGALWLICIVTSVGGAVLILPMIVRTDAATTAANVMAKESLFRLGGVLNLLSGASYLGVTVLLYHLLRPVNRTASLVAAVFGLTGVSIGAMASVVHFIPLQLLHGAQYGAFSAGELQTTFLFAVALAEEVFNIGMVFFGVQCFLVGYLIARSSYLPRTLGRLLAAGGAFTWPSRS